MAQPRVETSPRVSDEVRKTTCYMCACRCGINVHMKDGKVACFEVVPEEAGIPRAAPADLKGGDAETNAAAMRAMLDGEPGPFRDVVVYNAAAALIVAGKAESLEQGAALAAAAIDGGAAKATLRKLAAITHSAGANPKVPAGVAR